MLPVPGTRSRRFRVQKSRKTALTPLQVPPAITQDQERRTEGSQQQPLKLWGRRSAERRRQPLVRWDLTSRFTEGGRGGEGFVMMGGEGGREGSHWLPSFFPPPLLYPPSRAGPPAASVSTLQSLRPAFCWPDLPTPRRLPSTNHAVLSPDFFYRKNMFPDCLKSLRCISWLFHAILTI